LAFIFTAPPISTFLNSVTSAEKDPLESDFVFPFVVAPEGMTFEGTPIIQIADATPWGAPVLVSPDNGVKLFHYPRHTTLCWRPVIGAISYRVERQYDSGTWTAYAPVNVSGLNNTSYTFDFVGDQSGRWRVSAYNGDSYSPASGWRYFSYSTSLYISTPLLKSPAPNEIFHHYPRTVTLAWKPVPEAAGYKVEVQYCQEGVVNCKPYLNVTVGQTNEVNAYYQFNFVGAQPGRWRVTALGGDSYRNSPASKWRIFDFDI
jgi:hypothetical protein